MESCKAVIEIAVQLLLLVPIKAHAVSLAYLLCFLFMLLEQPRNWVVSLLVAYSSRQSSPVTIKDKSFQPNQDQTTLLCLTLRPVFLIQIHFWSSWLG